ncbi:hypothetical protein [Accumulibacter sp.]|uniref:hypothetical protein n=1 Tax=Accumulibacter sp. TaxID=2053492 RepID=UPI0035B15222
MTCDGIIESRFGPATLLGIPAVHFRVAFAALVNQLCADPDQRPDAIAVELGPRTAAAARRWFTELGIDPGRRTRLPYPLALTRRNHLLRPSVRSRALELQRDTGRTLEELPPRLLHEELGFAATQVAILSPTDSIVEAVRCAVELDVPLYGVDLDEMADSRYPCAVLPDPGEAIRTPGDYLREIIPLAAGSGADPEVDPRREYVMAARLKTLLARHQRLLFTGGVGHWARILRLLADEGVPNAVAVELVTADPPSDSTERTVVHPSLARHFLDTAPALADLVERRRRHPLLDAGEPYRPVDARMLLQILFRRAYRNHYRRPSAGGSGSVKPVDWSACRAFERTLHARSLLDMRSVPNLSLIEASARATLPPALRRTVSEVVNAYPWATPEQFPECVGLRSTVAAEGSSGQYVLCPNGWKDGGSPQPVAFHPLPENLPRAHDESAPSGRELAEDVLHRGHRFSWRPWESLVTALCCSAIGKTRGTARSRCAERFAGQLLEGVDIRRTLRAHASGQEEIWVRSSRPTRHELPVNSPDGFPVVWILGDDDADPCEWHAFFEPVAWLEAYANDRQEFRLRYPEQYARVVNFAACGEERSERGNGAMGSMDCTGMIVFAPVFPTTRQSCRWLEATGGRNNPLMSASDTGDQLVLRLAGTLLDDDPKQLCWQDRLVAGALALGGKAVTLVAPHGFQVAECVRLAAASRGKTIRRVDRSVFDRSHIDRIRRLTSMSGWLDKRDGEAFYTADAEQLAGESVEHFRELVPSFWRSFGLARSSR